VLIPASFKLVGWCCSCVLPPLPCIASYIEFSCIILGWAYCHVLVLCVYRIACFFSLVLLPLRSWGFVRLPMVLLQGFFFVFFMDPFFFLAGSQARWPYPWIPLLSLPCLVVSMLLLYVALPIIIVSPSPCCHETSNLWHLPSEPLFGYVTRLLSPSYSVVSCRWRWRSFHVGTCCWNITISIIIINTPIYWAWVEGLAFCSVFCSTHATLGADKPALCSLILRSLHGWVYGDPLTLRLWIKLLQQGPTLDLICLIITT